MNQVSRANGNDAVAKA